MNICVTGGAGFIGSHLVDRLIELGHNVLVIDNLSTGMRSFVHEAAQFIEMDVRDPKLVSIFEEFKPSIVFHEAAQTMVQSSMENPSYDCDVNLLGLINVLDACRHVKVEQFLMPSSAAVYGDLAVLPLTEELSGMPSSFYGLTKLTAEGYLRIYREAFGLNTVCFRYANVYGPRQGDGGEGGVISVFNRLIVEGQPLTVYGDGEQTRDFIYVDDVVDANIKAMGNSQCTGIYNVSTKDVYKRQTLGGALAYGHPYGCSGAILVLHCMAALESCNGRYGLCAIAGAGGTGTALIMERM